MWWAPVQPCEDYLMHHGIKGQKWGIRRYQNPDGTLTALGKQRYDKVHGEYINEYTRILQNKKKPYNQRVQETWKLNDSIHEKYKNKFGEELYNKILDDESGWGKVIENVYDSNYEDFNANSKNKKIVENGIKELDRLNNEYVDFWNTTAAKLNAESKPTTAIQKIKRAFEGEDRHNKRIADSIKSMKEYKDRKEEFHKLEKVVSEAKKKLKTEYKQASLDKILKSVPKDLQDDVYDYIYNFWWDYD